METIRSLCAETRVIPISAPEKENRGHTFPHGHTCKICNKNISTSNPVIWKKAVRHDQVRVSPREVWPLPF